MVERQDIDALLIGALYGELTPAEEERLAAHLEAHPADKALYADLTHARSLVRESGLTELLVEPPKQISTLLVQEAARRAPREEKESWFARLLRSFVAHPAMAAAMMLVVVIGFAAIVTRHKGDHFAGSEVSVSATARSEAAVAPAAPASDPAALAPTGALAAPMEESVELESASDSARGSFRGGAPSDSFSVSLSESTASGAEKATRPSVASPSSESAAQKRMAEPERKKAAPRSGAGRAAKESVDGALEVRTATPQPKDLDDAIAPTKAGRAPASSFTSSSSSSVSSSGYGAGAGAGAPPPSPTTVQAAREEAQAVMPAGQARNAAPAEAKPADPELAWAQQQHTQLISQVRSGNCSRAAVIAVALEERAPAYYVKHVANDRSLKSCQSYITAEREKAAEARAGRARVQSAEPEPAAPATSKQ
jgi:hypothetical protein